eukprot:6492425-Prymnesium_polylepis.1
MQPVVKLAAAVALEHVGGGGLDDLSEDFLFALTAARAWQQQGQTTEAEQPHRSISSPDIIHLALVRMQLPHVGHIAPHPLDELSKSYLRLFGAASLVDASNYLCVVPGELKLP